jgi:hypothetical protein
MYGFWQDIRPKRRCGEALVIEKEERKMKNEKRFFNRFVFPVISADWTGA